MRTVQVIRGAGFGASLSGSSSDGDAGSGFASHFGFPSHANLGSAGLEQAAAPSAATTQNSRRIRTGSLLQDARRNCKLRAPVA